jgi:propionate catabolism operon transcriptional regulator
MGEADVRAVVPELFAREAAEAPIDLRSARDVQEQAHIRRVLDECGGNHTAAAKRLGIGRATLWRKLSGRRDSEGP